MNDDAVLLMNRGVWFAGKPRSNEYGHVGIHSRRQWHKQRRLHGKHTHSETGRLSGRLASF
jgi:hypothetical protein